MNNPTYYTSFTEVTNKIGRGQAAIFGYLRQQALKYPENKIKLSQKNISEKTKLQYNQQSRYTKELESWGLLKVHRNFENKIECYQIFEVNFQLFIHFPEQYEKEYKSGNIDYLYTNNPTKNFIDAELVEKVVENAIEFNNLDLEKIKQNIKNMELPALPIDRTKSEITPYRSVVVSTKDISFNKQQEEKKAFLLVKSDSCGTVGKPGATFKRRKEKKKISTRDKLKAAPVAQPIVKLSAKRLSVNTNYNGRDFTRIKRHWNSLSGLRKIGDLIERQNKVLDNSVLAAKALLSGKFQMTTIQGKKEVFALPNNFDVTKQEITIHWLLDKITILHNLIHDNKLQPKNKDYLRKLSLADFILGAPDRHGDRNISVLFQYCCSDLKTIWEDPHPKLTRRLCKDFVLYTEQDKSFSGEELKTMSGLGDRLVAFSKKPDAMKSHNMGKGNPLTISGRFFVTQEQEWRGKILNQTPNYFAGEHAWSVFEKRLEY